MRTRKSNKKNYASKKSSVKAQKAKDTDPQWSKKQKCMTFQTTNCNKWWNIFQERYYNCLDTKTNQVKWFDNTDQNEINLMETQIHVSTSLDMAVTITIHFYFTPPHII